jgi:nucleotide-binding universal stress UspA family protein
MGNAKVNKPREARMRILMYYDGTEESKEAISIAKLHGKAFDAKIDVVSSLPKGGEHQLKEIEERESELEYVKTVFEKENIPCETHLLIRGHEAGEDIIRFAAEKNVDEIIIGTEKRTRVEKFLLGSVAQHVIFNSNRPVVIV